MQPTTCLHDHIPNPILQEADGVLHDPVAFHTANRMFNPNSYGRNPTIHHFLGWSKLPSTWFLLGLEDCDPWQDESLEAFVLIQTAPEGQGIAGHLCHDDIRRSPFTGGTQEANVTCFINQQEVFERVSLLLAAVVFFLLFRIFRPLDRSLGPIVDKRGDGAAFSVLCLASSAANSSAVRAGRRS